MFYKEHSRLGLTFKVVFFGLGFSENQSFYCFSKNKTLGLQHFPGVNTLIQTCNAYCGHLKLTLKSITYKP